MNELPSYIKGYLYWELHVAALMRIEHGENKLYHQYNGAHRSVVRWGTMLQAGRSSVQVPDEVDFFNLPNPSSRTMALGSTQNKYQKSFWGVKSGQLMGLTTLRPSESRMSENVKASTSRKPKGLHALYRDNFTFNHLQLVPMLRKCGSVHPLPYAFMA
jgi:hypothetical protein